MCNYVMGDFLGIDICPVGYLGLGCLKDTTSCPYYYCAYVQCCLVL